MVSKSKKAVIEEELDPLFDYRRVQPNIVCIDDDDHAVSKKRKKKKNPAVNADDYDDDEVLIIEPANVKDKAEEEDWLLPPPKLKVSNNSRKDKTREDSALERLRLKKQELLSMLNVEESPQAVEEPTCQRPKVIVSIQDKDVVKNYRVYKDDKLERLFKSYAESVKLDIQTLVFCFDGEKISSLETPDSLGLEDNDIIEVLIKEGSSEVGEQEQPSKSTSERPKVIVSIQDKDGLKNYRVYRDDKFERLFKTYAERVKLDLNTLVFSFDGEKISSTQTPDDLELENNDIIEVHIKKR